MLDEKKWLKMFFNQIISSSNAANALTCAQANQFFFPKTSNTCIYNMLQDVFDGLASEENLDFIAMSEYLNANAKGKFFPASGTYDQQYVTNPDWKMATRPAEWKWAKPNTDEQWSAAQTLSDLIVEWESSLYGVLELKTDNMLELIDRTNNRIYGEL